MRRNLLALLTSFVVLLLAASSASAITYGQPDGNGHPNVGALTIEVDGVKDWICSGTLIAPTVFLTASHCTEGLDGTTVYVTFDSVFDPGSRTFIAGAPHTNPGYNQRQSDTGDIAVVVLSRAPRGITPATLPTAGQLDQLAAQNGLHSQSFTAVGYGAQQRSTGGGESDFGPGGTRMVSTSTFNALNATFLRLSQNPATGDGGTCYGDSGGPNFLGSSSLIAGITITGDSVCTATNVTYRLDTPSARGFLQSYVTLP